MGCIDLDLGSPTCTVVDIEVCTGTCAVDLAT